MDVNFTANWNEQAEQYEVLTEDVEWFSPDGDNWFARNGELIDPDLSIVFSEAEICLVGGDQDGKTVS